MKNLDPIFKHLERIHSDYIEAARSIPGERWRESPSAGAWSAGEVTAHLMMTEEAILGGVKKMLQEPPRSTFLLKRFHVPIGLSAWRGKKVKTPIPLDANLICEKPDALEKFTSTRGNTLKFIESTRGRDLSAFRFRHPFLGSLNTYDWFRAIGYHELRHTKQIREIVETFRH